MANEQNSNPQPALPETCGACPDYSTTGVCRRAPDSIGGLVRMSQPPTDCPRRAPVAEDSPERLRQRREALGWSRHSSGSYWCLHCDATGDAPGDQDCSNCGGLGWRGPVQQPEPVRFQPGDLVRVVNCDGSPDNGREFIVHKVVGSSIYETPNHSWAPFTLELVRAAEQPVPTPEVVDVPQPDPEIATIATCLEALLALDPVTRKRAMWYLSERLAAIDAQQPRWIAGFDPAGSEPDRTVVHPERPAEEHEHG